MLSENKNFGGKLTVNQSHTIKTVAVYNLFTDSLTVQTKSFTVGS